ncbi:NAD(P)-dependent oxidoreductase [Rhodococcus sp. NPDC060090]|uniref:NAD(P)-dependent oxidoreductase n=1 Tax=Rhodococcus sp. NPDC060090 TaxID=3347056 RepID=UPI00365047AC
MTDIIGFLGAGQMGEPMVRRLLDAGHDVRLYARKEEVRMRLGGAGAYLADSVADVARQADILIVCLFSDAQLTELAAGPDGFMANAKAGAVVVSHTTGTVGTLAKIRADHPDGPELVDAPVSGSADDIAAGELTVLLGGEEQVLARVEAAVRAYADPIIRTGPFGSALNVKLVNNLLFAANAQLAAAAVELGEHLGIGSRELLDAIALCSGRSHALASISKVGGVETFDEFASPFLRKDVAACTAAAEDAGVDLGWLAAVVEAGPIPGLGRRKG